VWVRDTVSKGCKGVLYNCILYINISMYIYIYAGCVGVCGGYYVTV